MTDRTRKSERLTVRTDEDTKASIQKIMQIEDRTESAVVNRLLGIGIDAWNLDMAAVLAEAQA